MHYSLTGNRLAAAPGFLMPLPRTGRGATRHPLQRRRTARVTEMPHIVTIGVPEDLARYAGAAQRYPPRPSNAVRDVALPTQACFRQDKTVRDSKCLTFMQLHKIDGAKQRHRFCIDH